MDLIYNITQTGVNLFLFNFTVNSLTPQFVLVMTNPWTAEEKTAYLTNPDGDDGEWSFNIEGVTNLGYEDLAAGMVYFPNVGTYAVSVSESGNLIKNINLQII